MDIKEAIMGLRERVNKNNSNDNQSIDNIRAVQAINRAQLVVLEYLLDKRNEDDIRIINNLLVSTDLQKSTKDKTFINFPLPKNFFDFENLRVEVKKGDCIVTDFLVTEVKGGNYNILLEDKNNEPDYDHRESFYLISDSKLRVAYKNFDITSADLLYYRYPKNVEIEGYERSDGVATTNIDPELSTRAMEKVLDIAAMLYEGNNDNLSKIQYHFRNAQT